MKRKTAKRKTAMRAAFERAVEQATWGCSLRSRVKRLLTSNAGIVQEQRKKHA